MIGPGQLMGRREGDRGLADAAWADDRDEAPLGQLRHQRGHDIAAPDHAAELSRKMARGLVFGRRRRLSAVHLDDDRRHKTVAPAGDVGDVASARMAVTQRPPERRHMDPEVGVLDEGAGPDPGDEIILADQLAGVLDQGDEDVEGAAAEPDRLVALQEELLCRDQMERPERHGLLGRRR